VKSDRNWKGGTRRLASLAPHSRKACGFACHRESNEVLGVLSPGSAFVCRGRKRSSYRVPSPESRVPSPSHQSPIPSHQPLNTTYSFPPHSWGFGNPKKGLNWPIWNGMPSSGDQIPEMIEMLQYRRSIPSAFYIIGFLLAASLSTSCRSVGAKKLVSSHTAYNDAVQLTVTREVLANIVRSRYADPMQFIAVSAINAQFSVNVGGSAGEP